MLASCLLAQVAVASKSRVYLLKSSRLITRCIWVISTLSNPSSPSAPLGESLIRRNQSPVANDEGISYLKSFFHPLSFSPIYTNPLYACHPQAASGLWHRYTPYPLCPVHSQAQEALALKTDANQAYACIRLLRLTLPWGLIPRMSSLA